MIKGALPGRTARHRRAAGFGVTLPLGKPFLAAAVWAARSAGRSISYWTVATVITFGLSGLPLALTIVTGKSDALLC